MNKIILILILLCILGAAWWLGSPLFLDNVIDEEFPVTVAEAELLIGQEEFESTTMEESTPDETDVILQGEFIGADSIHSGSGSATVYKISDGSYTLRFENFSVTNGPDLRVLLAVDDDPSQSIELGKLKGNLGNQNYTIDDSIDISAYNSVIIYCKPFQVIFSTASLQ